MNEERYSMNESGSSEEDQPDSFIDFEQDNLTKEIMQEASKK